MGVLMVFVIPKFKEVFAGGLTNGPLPPFTLLVMGISDAIRKHIILTLLAFVVAIILFELAIHTKLGRKLFDQFKLKVPVFGPVFTKVAISRFTRTLGTLVSSGVPILQAVSDVHESVKEGETITAPLEASRVFPPMVISMVDVGEQTGALPEMLMKIADNYDEEVDNAVASMTSLLEPIMIVFLAVIVGSIVIAMFLPLIALMGTMGDEQSAQSAVAEPPK
jgi:type IV pilus assembly protein PilC